ncbi:MAG: hypothetical protein IGS39_19690 [Calothrix sp. C42_A2020_038]|nr:hypothetical protein [Calothrix sp. C42_A2020_038]
MNIKAIVLATIIGISAPAITEVAFSNPVLASSSFDFPEGDFIAGTQTRNDWLVSLQRVGQTYMYRGTNLSNGSSIEIATYPRLSGNKQRQVYTWTKNRHRYQISFRPNDPSVIRLQVFNPNGREILNRILQSAVSP